MGGNMNTKILVPLDGSISAERALPYLHWLALPEATEVVLVSVIDPAYNVYGTMNFTMPDLLTSIQADTEKYLQLQSTQLQKEGYKVTAKMRVGNPAGEILAIAKKHNVDMIAMATHGRSVLMRWILGSVAERVISEATVPIFLVREGCAVSGTQPARIMVPLDGSEFAEQALTTATIIAKRMKSELYLLNAIDGSVSANTNLYVETQGELDDVISEWREDMGAYLASKAEHLRTEGVVTQTRMVLDDPATAIEDIATLEEVSLIVMSTHGRTGLQRWLYGSVANEALHKVNSPLLLVRPSIALSENSPANTNEMQVPVIAQ